MSENGVLGSVVFHGRGDGRDPRKEIPELGFREYWYPAVRESKLRKRRPLKLELLGEILCLFRGADGPAAVADACPHRGASLSGGVCNYEGTVSCPYHGWTFDGAGECVAALPEGPNSRTPGTVRVRRYPTVVLKGIIFVWMGEGEPSDYRTDLPPELFDDSIVLTDHVVWRANWRLAVENLNDTHAPYTHRNSIQILMRRIPKRSFASARGIIAGGGITLDTYNDGGAVGREYQEFFPGVNGLWPRHKYRLMWEPIFKVRALRWLTYLGDGTATNTKENKRRSYHRGTQEYEYEWNQGAHLPGIVSIDGGSVIYRRWCVPIDKDSTREFFFYSTRANSRITRWRERAKYLVANKMMRNRNLGIQDGKVLQLTRYDLPEKFSAFDVETITWRRLAILASRHGGRHDKIPTEVIEALNSSSSRNSIGTSGDQLKEVMK
jgi:phenylpropionate dioxygenase-like ring-hydroxylating dioxygenase large terminal subunit